jgi:hypothetical protein
MQKCDIQHPIIDVAINGNTAEKRPSEFRLLTFAGCGVTKAQLLYPAESAVGGRGDTITVSLIADDKTDLYYTGTVYSNPVYGKYRKLQLTDGAHKLLNTDVTAAYRKEKASVILSDMLDAAGIKERAITCPDVELARFSTRSVPAWHCVDYIIDALKQHGAKNLTFFFDAKDVFHFGTLGDTGKNEGEPESFESGKNIFRSGEDWIEVLPRPIRHSQKVTVNGKERVTVKTDLTVSQKHTRLRLTFGGPV